MATPNILNILLSAIGALLTMAFFFGLPAGIIFVYRHKSRKLAIAAASLWLLTIALGLYILYLN